MKIQACCLKLHEPTRNVSKRCDSKLDVDSLVYIRQRSLESKDELFPIFEFEMEDCA